MPRTRATPEVDTRKLRELRIRAGLGISELAQATGLGYTTLTDIETGRRNGTLDTHIAIARALHCAHTDFYVEGWFDSP